MLNFVRAALTGLSVVSMTAGCQSPGTAPRTQTPRPIVDCPIGSIVATEFVLAGPSDFKRAFLATNVGSLMNDDDGTVFADRLRAMAFGDQPETQALEQWQGTVAGQVLLWREGRAERVATVVHFTPEDGHSPLPFEAIAQSEDGWKAGTQSIDNGAAGEVEVRTLTNANDSVVLCPELHGVIYCNKLSDGERQAIFSRLQGLPPLASKEPLHVQVHLDMLMPLLAEGDKDTEAIAVALLGMGSLQTLDIKLAPAGPHVQLELSMLSNGGPRGLFAGLFPDVEGLPTDILAPADHPAYKVGHLDLKQVALAVGATIAAANQRTQTPQAALEDILGFDLFEPFLDHLGTQSLMLVDPPSKVTHDDFLDDAVLAVRLKDPEAFHAAWPEFKDSLFGILGGRVTDDYKIGDATVYHTSTFLMPDLAIAVSPRYFAFAIGNGGTEQLTELLEEPAERAAEQVAGIPQRLAGPGQHAAPGLNGYATARIDIALDRWARPLLSLLGEFVGMGLEQVFRLSDDERDALRPLLEKHNLERATSFTSYKDNRWTLRILW